MFNKAELFLRLSERRENRVEHVRIVALQGESVSRFTTSVRPAKFLTWVSDSPLHMIIEDCDRRRVYLFVNKCV